MDFLRAVRLVPDRGRRLPSKSSISTGPVTVVVLGMRVPVALWAEVITTWKGHAPSSSGRHSEGVRSSWMAISFRS